jgi:2-polyprenyl-3-methyl-5-hydroxy-6-metoxy-1,4-benzoquinol methylase
MLRKLAARFRRWFLGDALWAFGRDPDALRLNIKNFGYELARALAPGLARVDVSGEPSIHGLRCKATTQADVESAWFVWWCRELKNAPLYHRKLWEYAFLLQALFENGALRPGMRGLGFGCGEEPIASYLASKGIAVTVTDLDPARARGLGWMETAQHTSAVEQAFKPELVSRDRFEGLVQLEYVDMNDIPSRLHGQYDFCWSICALEHLGSIEKGMRFVENAMATLKPGGLAVHTTEFNYLSEDETLDEPPTVLFLRRHLVELRERLQRAGHQVNELDFDTGNGPLDRFIDLPPYEWDAAGKRAFGTDLGRLKLAVGRFPSTCFGIVGRAAPLPDPSGRTGGGTNG